MKLKVYLFSLVAMFVAADLVAQDKKPASPTETVEGTIDGVKTKVTYSRPSARGRKMVGGVDPYGKVWRTGANDRTVVEFDQDVMVEGNALPKGKYALFSIPGEAEWVIIFNKELKGMGAYGYKETEDALRVTVKPQPAASFVETFTITPEKDKLSLTWENYYVPVMVKAAGTKGGKTKEKAKEKPKTKTKK